MWLKWVTNQLLAVKPWRNKRNLGNPLRNNCFSPFLPKKPKDVFPERAIWSLIIPPTFSMFSDQTLVNVLLLHKDFLTILKQFKVFPFTISPNSINLWASKGSPGPCQHQSQRGLKQSKQRRWTLVAGLGPWLQPFLSSMVFSLSWNSPPQSFLTAFILLQDYFLPCPFTLKDDLSTYFPGKIENIWWELPQVSSQTP